MAHQFIKDLTPGRTIEDIFLISQPILRSTSKGDLYIAAFLSDRTGKLNARMWQATEGIYNELPQEGFVKIKGKTELYQGNLQLVLADIRVVDASTVSLEDYLPRTTKNIRNMFDRLTEIADRITHPGLKALAQSFLTDEQLMHKFCRAPAAVQMHHCYLGGLLEHTLGIMESAEALFALYPQVQPDLVRIGILLHDMGKTEELSYEMAFSYTTKGQLVGHIAQTCLMVQDRVNQLRQAGTDIEQEVVDALMHIILSHHGQYDFGSPKLPATIEAFMVTYLDNLDAKMNQVHMLAENEPGDGEWTAWQRSLETRIYRQRLLD
jgi:3'-5' exoribonuclease